MVWQPLKFSQFRFFFGHEIFEMQFSSMKFWTWTLGSRGNRRFAFDIAAFAEFWIIHRKYNRYENDIKSENGTDSRLISHFRLKITISGFKNELLVGNLNFWTKTLKWTMISVWFREVKNPRKLYQTMKLGYFKDLQLHF